MPAMLLPLLAAGIGGSELMSWLGERRDQREGERIGGILDQLGEGAGPDATAQALARGGLLGTEAGQGLMQHGFGDYESARDYREQLGAIGAQGAQSRLTQNNGLGIWQQQQEYLSAQEQADRERVAEADRLAREQQDQFNSQILTDYGNNQFADPATRAAAADLARRDKVQKFAEANGISLATPEQGVAARTRQAEQVDEMQGFDRGIANATFLRDNMAGLSHMPQGFWSGDEGKAMKTRLGQSATELFYNWKQEVYGEAEPPPAVIEQLQSVFGDPVGLMTDKGKTVRLADLMRREMEAARDQKVARAKYVNGDMSYDEFLTYRSTLPSSEWAKVLKADAKPPRADVPEGVDPDNLVPGGKRSGASGGQ
jgi:hypothetical protein